ncbi:hypothetical protein ACFQHO_14905 [Actinomadura yumaensis]|uniref:pPIWI_RE_Y domain-containing protein n=1 Tax=Actinomadura yumaensis TaxID=111807 RepID=UPI00362034BB
MPDAEEPWWEEEPALGTPNPLEQLTGPAFNANESLRILGLVAVTVTRLGEWPPGEEFTVPYPDVAQTAVDRICLAGIRRFCNDHEGDGPKYPRSLQELLAWCRERDVQEWGFIDLPADLELAGRLLVEDTAAPRACARNWRSDISTKTLSARASSRSSRTIFVRCTTRPMLRKAPSPSSRS